MSATIQPLSNDKPSFSTLADEIMLQIVDFLLIDSPSSVYNLLFLEKTAAVAKEVLYRTLWICPPKPQSENWGPSDRLIHKMLHLTDDTASLVQNVVVDYIPTRGGAKKIRLILQQIPKLKSFCWNVSQLMPHLLLLLLSSKFPEVTLHVKNNARGKISRNHDNRIMDLDLLLSPQLRSLEYTVLQSSVQEDKDEMQIVAHIMRANANLKRLRLGCKRVLSFNYGEYKHRFPEFGINQGDYAVRTLPFLMPEQAKLACRLEELTFLFTKSSQRMYRLNIGHCQIWKVRMDWCGLRTLDLGALDIYSFFGVFTGVLPQLRALGITFDKREILWARHWGRVHPPLGEFLDSIKSLEELCVRNRSNGFFSTLWPHVKKRGQSLQVLRTENISAYTIEGWTASHLDDIKATCKYLKELSIDVELDDEPMTVATFQEFGLVYETRSISRFKRHCHYWPLTAYGTIAQNSTLRRLTIRARLLTSDIAEHNDVDREMSEAIAKYMFQEFFINNPGSRLRVLELSASRLDPIVGRGLRLNTVMVRVEKKAERDDVPSPLKCGFIVKVECHTERLKGGFE